MLSREKRTLDNFRRWKVPELKQFLRIHGLKTTGTKDELTTLAFGAEQLSVPVPVGRGNHTEKNQYQSLLHANGEQLPDLFTELKDNWISEEKGVEKWPLTLQMQIAEFILTAEQVSDLGKRLLSDYKEGKAFSYFDSQWLKEVFYQPISDTQELCFLKSQLTPSQRIGNVPHKIWVCLKKINGTVDVLPGKRLISCVYNSICGSIVITFYFFFSLGSTCNHVAAVLLKVEHAWKSDLTLGNSPTLKECAWNKYGANKKGVEPKRISEMKWKKPHHSKKGMQIISVLVYVWLFAQTGVTCGYGTMGLIEKSKQETIQNSDKRLARENVACEKRFSLPLKVLYIT